MTVHSTSGTSYHRVVLGEIFESSDPECSFKEEDYDLEYLEDDVYKSVGAQDSPYKDYFSLGTKWRGREIISDLTVINNSDLQYVERWEVRIKVNQNQLEIN